MTGKLSLRNCAGLQLSREPLCCAVSIHHRLAAKDKLLIEDLYGENLLMMRRGWSHYVDRLRDDLWQNHKQIHIVDFEFYNMTIFNRNGKSSEVFVFEAFIDMLLYISLHKNGWREHSYPNLPNLLYIGHLTYLWNPYKINVFGLFSFTFICIIDIIIFSDYTYVWGNRRGISGIFEKQKWYYIRV